MKSSSYKDSNSQNFLLLHMRKDPEVCVPEYQNFLEHTRLKKNHLYAINLCEHPNLDPGILDRYDAFLIGGYSDDPSDRLDLDVVTYPFIKSLNSLLKYAVAIKKPGLLSCGGFMLASVLLGGELTLDRAMKEMDILPITLTEKAKNDPLLSSLPDQLSIVSGHLKSTNKLPPNTDLLAYSDRCPIHAFKITDAPIYAFQGHPEMTANQLKERVEPYKDKYFNGEEDYKRFISNNASTKEANQILSRFVEMINGTL